MVFIGIGVPFAFAAMAKLIVDAVRPSETGVATGMNTVMRTIGSVIGGQVRRRHRQRRHDREAATCPPSRRSSQRSGSSAAIAVVGAVLARFIPSRRSTVLRPRGLAHLTSRMTRVRFAPSPTGTLHVGNALSAVANRRFGDWLLLRIDDTDAARNLAGRGGGDRSTTCAGSGSSGTRARCARASAPRATSKRRARPACRSGSRAV